MKTEQSDLGKTQEAAPQPGVRLRTGSIVTLLFLAVFAVAMIKAWKWPYIAQLIPLYFVAIPGIVLCLIQVYRELVGWRKGSEAKQGKIQMDEVIHLGPDTRREALRTLAFFGWLTAGAVGIWLIGITIALPAFAFSYALLDGHEKWPLSLLLAAGTFLFLWGLFEYILNIRWPLGLLFT